jgi:signal peptidase I
MIISLNYLFILVITLVLLPVIIVLDRKAMKVPRNFLILGMLAGIVWLCYQNFPVSLTLLTLISGIIVIIDFLFFARSRKQKKQNPNIIVRDAREFFPVLLLVWIIRSFIIQPYHVPTGSLEPTVMPGDFIAVKQYAYGLRFPIGNYRLINTGEPKVGQIALLYYPVDPSIVFVKRVIGVPGDHIVYRNKVLYVNGIEAKQKYLGTAQDVEPGEEPIFVERREEDLNGVKHEIFVRPTGGQTQDFDLIVPQGKYFMMGDNRDDSDDSRVWGYVPEQNLIGEAFRIIISWDPFNHHMRWDRSGKAI